MNRAFQFTLFFSGFLLIYTALNSYILLRLGGLLEVKKKKLDLRLNLLLKDLLKLMQ